MEIRSAAGHPDCPWCARAWWKFLRELMKRAPGGSDFYAAAATSIRAP